MDITVIGTGNMGHAITTRALAGNHSVTLLGTETAKAEAVAGQLSGDVRAGQVGDPLVGDVVVLAVWYAAVDDIISRYQNQLDGKIVIDITNPIDVDAFEPLELAAGSAAQEIAGKAPGARVVKAFNTTFAATVADGRVAGEPLDVLIASDDEEAKERSAGSSANPACARSTLVRSGAHESSRRSATSTWRSSNRLGLASRAR